MNKRWLFLIAIFVFINSAYASNLKNLDTVIKPSHLLKPKVLVDSLLLSDKLRWSFRIVSNFKEQRFKLNNKDGNAKFIPNNPYGVGFGVANQKLVIDILFNIKTKNKEHTKKFAAEGALLLKKNLFSFILENVHGYGVSASFNDFEEFREDLQLFSLGLNYLHLFNNKYITVRAMKSGLYGNQKSAVEFGLGGFIIVNNLNADSSIIPEDLSPYFNEKAQITEFFAIGGGVLAGVLTHIPLPANFYLSIYIAPGIGLEYKNVYTETENYQPSKPMLYKADAFGSIGYNRKKFYINFTFATNTYFTSLGFDNRASLSVTKSKLIVGYNIGHINFRPKHKKSF